MVFAALPHQLRRDPRLNPRAVVLAAALLEYARDEASCWPSNARLAADMRCGPRTVQIALAALRDAGWIAVEPADHQTGRVIRLLWRSAPRVEEIVSVGVDSPPMTVLLDLAGTEDPGDPLLDLPIDQLLRRRAGYLRSLPHPEYLLTSHWRACRERAIERAGGACQVCHSAEEPNVHHRSYERLGDEAEADLIVLCRACHERFHANGKLARPAHG
jgi:hypothetical protein